MEAWHTHEAVRHWFEGSVTYFFQSSLVDWKFRFEIASLTSKIRREWSRNTPSADVPLPHTVRELTNIWRTKRSRPSFNN